MTEWDETEQVLVWNGLVGTGSDEAEPTDALVPSLARTDEVAAADFDEGRRSE